jgi:hypothetical protein
MAWTEVAAIIDATAQQIRDERAERRAASGAGVPRKRNDLLDALVLACGSNPEETTPTAFRTAAVALADIRSVCPDLTGEEIARRALAYRRKHPQWPLTPGALAKHWAAIGGGNPTEAAKRDIYVEPPNWRKHAAAVLGIGEEVLLDKNWFEISPDTRTRVLRNIQ